MKIDDIPVFGSYPITREDYVVESALTSFFSQMDGVNVVEKLHKRHYKKPWPFVNAVYYTNPLLGGDYSEFENYYGAQFMIGYRILWKEQRGIYEIGASDTRELSDRIVGIYVKFIDMANNGEIILSERS